MHASHGIQQLLHHSASAPLCCNFTEATQRLTGLTVCHIRPVFFANLFLQGHTIPVNYGYTVAMW